MGLLLRLQTFVFYAIVIFTQMCIRDRVNMVLTDPNSSAFAGFHNDYEIWDEETTIMQYIGYNMNSPVFSNYRTDAPA